MEQLDSALVHPTFGIQPTHGVERRVGEDVAEDADAAETETEITKADDPEPVTDAPADESGDDAKAAEDE